MKITCPKNKDHKTFNVTAHVSEVWIVDENGDYLDRTDGASHVVHEPDVDDLYTCDECTAEAKVES